MKRRDLIWIALTWIGALSFTAWVASSADAADRFEVAGVLAPINVGIATGLYFFVRRNVHDRGDVLCIAGIWVPLLGAVAVVVAATSVDSGDAGFVAGVVGFLLTGWYLERSRKRRRAERLAAAQPTRTCPQCKRHMQAEARVCSRCGTDSPPWAFFDGSWWTRDEEGRWQCVDTESDHFGSDPDGDPTAAITEIGGREA